MKWNGFLPGVGGRGGGREDTGDMYKGYRASVK